MDRRRSLDERLAAAGVEAGTDPRAAWRRLHAVEGRRATVLDLYELVARERGVAGHRLPRAERLALARGVMPELWPGFAQTQGSERGADPLLIVDYDPEWPKRYARWEEALRSRLGGAAVRVEHVGSTSVPGLAAKPIIDIQVSVADLADEGAYVPAVEGAGLLLRSRDDLHRYFRPVAGRPRDVHVHVCTTGSEWEREHLLFRDYLRAHPPARAAYAEAKREASMSWADDWIAYTEAKTEVVLTILEAAEAWARASRDEPETPARS